MREDKDEALILRKQGVSYHKIHELLHIPKSTLSDWLRDVDWSQQVKKQLEEKSRIASTVRIIELTKARKKDLDHIYETAREEARQEFENFKLYPLFITGIALYWGEGDRLSKYQVRLGNTDPLMIETFVSFLLDVCGVRNTKIHASILIYPDINAEACLKFWIQHSRLEEKNFQKTIIIQGRHKTRRLQNGVCTVGVSSRYLKEKFRVWLTLFPEEFKKRQYMRAGIV